MYAKRGEFYNVFYSLVTHHGFLLSETFPGVNESIHLSLYKDPLSVGVNSTFGPTVPPTRFHPDPLVYI